MGSKYFNEGKDYCDYHIHYDTEPLSNLLFKFTQTSEDK